MSYLAYRDDMDLATALRRDGHSNSAWLVLGMVVGSAAALEAKAREAEKASKANKAGPNSQPIPGRIHIVEEPSGSR